MTASNVRDDALESLVARVADEFVARLKQGERLDVEEYTALHPEHAGVLREVLVAAAGRAVGGGHGYGSR